MREKVQNLYDAETERKFLVGKRKDRNTLILMSFSFEIHLIELGFLAPEKSETERTWVSHGKKSISKIHFFCFNPRLQS